MSMISKKNWNKIVLVTAISAGIFSCIKPASDELFPPATTASCTDGVLNQGEYFIDCGGPCEPCAVGKPSVSFQADSTWLPKNPANQPVNSDFAAVGYSGGRIYITAADTFGSLSEQISISFTIPDSFMVGVHEVNNPVSIENYLYAKPFGPVGQVYLDYGIIKVTNRDTVYNLISGEFKYTCKPDPITGYRVAIRNGFFRDIPTVPAAP